MSETPEPIVPVGWAKPVGYAHGMVAAGRVVAIAGQVGWDPATSRFETGDFVAQTAQALRNVVAVLRAAGGEPRHLVRLTWYILDREEYLRSRKALGPVYREILGTHFPAMTVVVVSGLLEDRARIEIEATAVIAPAPS
jgi:enamine deaminase RidA (YjgF/YER057c/UK114 family)